MLVLAVWIAGTGFARPGLQWSLTAVAALGLTGWAAHARPEHTRFVSRWWQAGFGLLAVAMFATLAIGDSGPMMAVVVAAALGVAAYAVSSDGRLLGLILVPWYATIGWLRALAWWPRLPRESGSRVAARRPLLRGAALGVVLVIVVGGLLASADRAFLGLISQAVPTWDPGALIGRVVLAAVVISVVAALMFNAASPPPLELQRAPKELKLAEWLVPVAALVVLLGVFFAVQAAVLFDAYPAALVSGGLTPAERARQGFGQLVVVSLIVTGTLGWAASRSVRAHRAAVLISGGLLLLQLELLVASALRRMYLYESTFGWTVLRVEVAVFEVWLGLTALALALLWVAGLGRVVVRIGVVSAGVGVLLLALAGPDRVVANASLTRLEVTGEVDTGYLAELGPDAVPTLAQLPEPHRSCALVSASRQRDPVYAVNLSRWRAERVLSTLDLSTDPSVLAACPAR